MPTNTLLRNIWLCWGGLGLALSSCAKEPAISSVQEEKLEFEGVDYRMVRLLPSQLELAWKGTDGTPMRGFDIVQSHYEQENKRCVLLMNAGIYEPGGIPSGVFLPGIPCEFPLSFSVQKLASP